MSSLNRAVKNCLPTIPKEHKATQYSPHMLGFEVWSCDHPPDSYATIKAISLCPALRVKAQGRNHSNTNTALTKQPQYSSPTWLELEEIFTICTHARDTKIYCARTSLRSTLNMLTRTGCYSKGLEKNKMQLIFMMKEQKHYAENQDQVQFLNWISTDTFCCLFFLEGAENNLAGLGGGGAQNSAAYHWMLLFTLSHFLSKGQISLQIMLCWQQHL